DAPVIEIIVTVARAIRVFIILVLLSIVPTGLKTSLFVGHVIVSYVVCGFSKALPHLGGIKEQSF
ncbi:MAG: hypothetical protein ABJI88_01785, partial [Lentilitoribacter sp.]